MTEVTFGDTTLFLHRATRVCCIVSGSGERLHEAIAVAATMHVDKVIVVAPEVDMALIPALRKSQELFVYEYGK